MKTLRPDFLPEIREAAAQNNGKPLTVGQRERVIFKARFLQVVRLAGYQDGTSIVERHFEEYMRDVGKSATWKFSAMVQEVEESTQGNVNLKLYVTGTPLLTVQGIR